jgi:Fe(3+) dicitrate transport protein
MKKSILLTIVSLLYSSVFSQVITQKDTLKEVKVIGNREISEIERLSDLHQTYISAGKKNEVINMSALNANIAEKTPRQVFAKVPGVFVYDMDGSGNQVNIATRGLDPHRSWEYNIRQNFIMTNSDVYGYPANHYSPPMESVQKIEIIRGTSSLQYGSQFGGMINYITKTADTARKVSFENLNSVGSYGLLSSYNALSGTLGKLSYYAYYHKRVSDGYRKNSNSDAESMFLSVAYRFSSNAMLKAEIGHSKYVYHIPGPLTDSMFYADPRQATRSRNYFNPDIYVPSITLDWKIDDNTRLNFVSSAVLGQRNSVQFVGFADAADKIDPQTDSYKNRQVDIDGFNSYASEIRLSHRYNIAGMSSVVVSGVRYTNNDLHRRQLGKGTIGTDFDLSLTNPNWGRDVHFKTRNVAFFAENMIYITPAFSVSPGIRYEAGNTDMTGSISYYKPENLPTSIKHYFPLLGINLQYQLNPESKLYGGISQAYRPVIFADVIPATTLDRTDPNLKDAEGYNAEIGWRSGLKNKLRTDISLFQVNYQNRIGSLILQDADGTNYIYKTNTGNTITNGVEFFMEWKPLPESKKVDMSFFTATSYMYAYYTKGSVTAGTENRSIVGNKLECVPEWIGRNGLNLSYKIFSATLQYSYVSSSFSDALNTDKPSTNGAKGKVPGYGLLDLNTSWFLSRGFLLKLGVNNLTNQQYFTKRPSMYPGAGVWSSDGRSVVVTFGVKI